MSNLRIPSHAIPFSLDVPQEVANHLSLLFGYFYLLRECEIAIDTSHRAAPHLHENGFDKQAPTAIQPRLKYHETNQAFTISQDAIDVRRIVSIRLVHN